MEIQQVINAMLAMQRHSWEQGVCAQALYEADRRDLWIPMAYDAVRRMGSDGRLALLGSGNAVSDPASNGEVCLRAYEETDDPVFKEGAERMLEYLLKKAPRTSDGIICHNAVSHHEGFSPYQIWIDGLYMVPPFLAAMGCLDEAAEQVRGYHRYLYDRKAHLFDHIYDVEQGFYVRKVHWATGNGWALMGLTRLADLAARKGRDDLWWEFVNLLTDVLKNMLEYRLPDGRFPDILDDPKSFADGTSAMMAASAVYRGHVNGYLDFGLEFADKAFETVTSKIDEYGLLREVCGCPDFVSEGTSAEAQAAYIIAWVWKTMLRR